MRAMRARTFIALLPALIVAALLTEPALAVGGGEGLYGKADDKVITNFGFGLMIFFTVLVVGLSIAQRQLEKRKERK
jgi:tellurite resistance protein TehA-like permease